MTDSSVAEEPGVAALNNPVVKASGYYVTYSQGSYQLGFYGPDGSQLMASPADADLIAVVQTAFAQGAAVNATLFVNRPQWFAIKIDAPKAS
jgi:hypothetical protein